MNGRAAAARDLEIIRLRDEEGFDWPEIEALVGIKYPGTAERCYQCARNLVKGERRPELRNNQHWRGRSAKDQPVKGECQNKHHDHADRGDDRALHCETHQSVSPAAAGISASITTSPTRPRHGLTCQRNQAAPAHQRSSSGGR